MNIAFPVSGLYAITDCKLWPGTMLLEAVDAAIHGGAKAIQYRHKEANRDISLVKKLRVLCNDLDTPLIINDDIELARKVYADGVHLGKHDCSIEQARKYLGNDALIGISCYNSSELARKAQRDGASYVAFGRFFPSKTKPHAPTAELKILNQPGLTIPMVAIGGITADNGAILLEHGANLLAVIDAVFGQPNPRKAAASFQHLFNG